MIFRPNWIARGPPDPSTGFELVTSGVSGRKPKLAPAVAEGSVQGIVATRSSKRIRDIGMIQNVEELGSELSSEAFLELPSLRH
ncbi:MAG: hypothetical protein DMG13_23270 [Acidobacteria bacterium]|nr:MAG: hypothetical protein DMG13_23270 [Acidobacteriota bacterium]